MKLYNTLTRSKEEFTPITPGHVKLYTCGPTVYHYYHIGNLRNAIFNDTLKRVLRANDYVVDHIMNITDVGHLTSDADEGGDKLEARAAEEGKTVWEVADYYTKVFMDDMQALEVIPPIEYVTATSMIDQQIKMVQVLLDKGFAYQAKQAIYFDVRKLDDYGKLTGQSLKQKEVGVRDDVITDPEKRNPQDFALWFFTVGHFADHQMRWKSPWGEGFPGWHLECSAIIEAKLGTTIDIHTGGVDHIGTHHTNEIAQSEAAHDGSPLANYWLHNEFLLVDGKKMSKSQGNSNNLEKIVRHGHNPMDLRMLYLQSHYRSEQNFSVDGLYAAATYLARLNAWADGQFQQGDSTLADDVFETINGRVLDALSDDLNTPQALVIINELLDAYEQKNLMPGAAHVQKIDALLGLQLTARADLSAEQKALITEREGARANKDYAASDKARDELKTAGIELDDVPHGTRWRRVEPAKR